MLQFYCQNVSYQLLIFAKRRKTSEILTLNSLNFIPNSSGVAVGKSRKGIFFENVLNHIFLEIFYEKDPKIAKINLPCTAIVVI